MKKILIGKTTVVPNWEEVTGELEKTAPFEELELIKKFIQALFPRHQIKSLDATIHEKTNKKYAVAFLYRDGDTWGRVFIVEIVSSSKDVLDANIYTDSPIDDRKVREAIKLGYVDV